jgi:hypothetical protein
MADERRKRHDEVGHHVGRHFPQIASPPPVALNRIPQHPGRQHAQGDRVGQTASSHQISLRDKL